MAKRLTPAQDINPWIQWRQQISEDLTKFRAFAEQLYDAAIHKRIESHAALEPQDYSKGILLKLMALREKLVSYESGLNQQNFEMRRKDQDDLSITNEICDRIELILERQKNDLKDFRFLKELEKDRGIHLEETNLDDNDEPMEVIESPWDAPENYFEFCQVKS